MSEENVASIFRIEVLKFSTEGGDSIFLRNIGICPHDY
jgi:hypothetical protein